MRVLDAEWAYLTRPQRREELMAIREGRADEATEETQEVALVDETKKAEPETKKVETVAKVAAIAPASGTTVAHKPAAKEKTKLVAVKAPMKNAVQAQAKIANPKAASADADFVWSIKRKTNIAAPTQMASYPKRAGVARPILE